MIAEIDRSKQPHDDNRSAAANLLKQMGRVHGKPS
jgi:hypothetical protein